MEDASDALSKRPAHVTGCANEADTDYNDFDTDSSYLYMACVHSMGEAATRMLL